MIEENFFNFQFIIDENRLVCTKFNWEVIDWYVWDELYIIKQKYDKMKKRKKVFDKKQQKYCEDLEAWRKDKEHLQEHIRKAESKLSEYKNVILAFGKLATCNSISK